MRAPRPTSRATIAIRAAGVLLVVGGLATLGGVAWQTWGVSGLAAAGQAKAADAQTRAWAVAPTAPTPAPTAASRIPVATAPVAGGTVAVIRIPRFGASWSRVVRQGVDEATILDSFDAGVGHYPGTAMPGGVGNFAVAAHDTGWGDSFLDLAKLRIGDRVDVETAAGTYVYAFRNFQWVQPSHVSVLLPVPDAKGVVATARLITLTTCDPPYDARERVVAYGTFVSFTPRSA